MGLEQQQPKPEAQPPPSPSAVDTVHRQFFLRDLARANYISTKPYQDPTVTDECSPVIEPEPEPDFEPHDSISKRRRLAPPTVSSNNGHFELDGMKFRYISIIAHILSIREKLSDPAFLVLECCDSTGVIIDAWVQAKTVSEALALRVGQCVELSGELAPTDVPSGKQGVCCLLRTYTIVPRSVDEEALRWLDIVNLWTNHYFCPATASQARSSEDFSQSSSQDLPTLAREIDDVIRSHGGGGIPKERLYVHFSHIKNGEVDSALERLLLSGQAYTNDGLLFAL